MNRRRQERARPQPPLRPYLPLLLLASTLAAGACQQRPFFDQAREQRQPAGAGPSAGGGAAIGQTPLEAAQASGAGLGRNGPIPNGPVPNGSAPSGLIPNGGAPNGLLPAEPLSLTPDAQVTPDPPTGRRPVGGVFPGTGTFVQPAPPSGRGVLRTPAGEMTLNFIDTDLREVVKAILGDTLGANYVVDPQIQGTVTLQTSQPMPGASLIPVLESILAVNNATLVESGGIYRVIPADQGIRQSGGPRAARAAAQAPGAQVLVVPLRHVSAVEVEKLLAPFAPPGGILRVDQRRNLVMIGGNRTDVASMLDVIETFDVDWLAGMSFGLFPIQATTAKTMAEELEKVFGDQAEGPLAGVVRFVPIERLNAVLVISSRATYVERARTWIDRLDVGEDETPRLYVYYCENSRAEDLAGVLNQAFGSGGDTQRPAAQVAPGLQPARLEGQPPAQAPGELPVPGLPPGIAPGADGAQGGPGSPSPPSVPRVGGGDEGVSVGTGAQIRIVADKVKNALVILAKPRDYRTVEAALRRLDIIPLQVLIEATILEVSLNDTLRYGVEWFFRFGGSSRVGQSGLSTTDGAFSVRPFSGIASSVFPGFSYLLTPTQDSVAVVVNALDEVSDVTVISSPQVFVLDNQTASIIVGDQVPITTRSAQSTITADAQTVNSIEYRDTGVILEVKPRVNAGGLVSMEVSQEVSNVASVDTSADTTTSSQADSPTIRQRKLETTVAVQNGETVALGGLITDNRQNTSSGLPWLSRLPLIGWLFGNKGEGAARTELLVLITPRVVNNTESARAVTNELRSRLRSLGDIEQRVR